MWAAVDAADVVVPPDDGYGAAGNQAFGVRGTDTLVFVVDPLDAT